MNLDSILEHGCQISSSGTTGYPKTIFRTPENLQSCIDSAIKGQSLTKNSSVYTVTRMTHAGGLLLQTLPAHTLGCTIEIEKFNAYTFLKHFKRHTHTFIAPAMCEAVIRTKSFKTQDLTGKFVAMGSDPIPAHHIQAFIDRGATVLANWGMSEIGPWVINKLYKLGDTVDDNILGNRFWTEYKVKEDELYVKGPMCIYDDWLPTGDLVQQQGADLYYVRRK